MTMSSPAAVGLLLAAFILWKFIFNRTRSAKAPGIGYGSLPILGVWKGVYNFMKDPAGIMERGCKTAKNGYFRVTNHAVEYLLVADRKKIDEYLAAPEDVLSFHDNVMDILQVEWTLGYGVAHRPYHISLVRTKFTQSIALYTSAMFNEIKEGMDTLIGKPKDWTAVTVYQVFVRIVAIVSNNAFSGMEFCRNDAFLDVAIEYAQGVVISAEILRLFPDWIKPFVALFTPYARVQKKARALMGPYVQQRIDAKWEGKEKPKDMIQFLIDAAPDVELTMPQIVERMMTLNMASIHTTTMTTTAVIILLASNPEYIPELRAEALEHSVDGGFDKLSLHKLTKLDSFLRECGRVEPLGIIGLVRKARKDFTFSDGMVVPAGSAVAAPIAYLQTEGSDLTNPLDFDGFRYYRANENSIGPTKHQMVSTDLNYLLFGHGKHSCPGRFLAVTELKLILANLILNYDLKAIEGTKPKNFLFGTAKMPDLNYQILLKARDLGAKA